MPDTPASWRERLAALGPLAAVPTAAPRLVAAAVAVAGLAVATAVAVVALRGAPPPPELSLPRAAPPGSGGVAADGSGGPARAEPDPDAYVHVAGAVARPGVYRVRPGGRVTDVVDAAGGPGPEADVDQLNLAAKVGDGERVYVPRRGEAPPAGGLAAGPVGAPGGGGTGGGTGAAPLDLNTATVEQLDALPGVGPATAQAILDYRREHGRFSQVQELLEVRGIGEARLAALRARVRV